jgi:hypothetical protein
MIALTDMRPNLTIAALLLVAGVAYVLFLARRDHGGAKSARWVPWVSLAAGPLCGLGFWSVDVYVANPTHYPLPSDSTALLGAVLLIGAFAGCVGPWFSGSHCISATAVAANID